MNSAHSSCSCRLALFVLSLVGLTAADTAAQPLGAFYWQLAPFCNVVALHITQYVTPPGAAYALNGFDDQCGAMERATVVGTATFNHDGTVGVGLTIVTTPTGTPVHVDARVSLSSLSGPWTDSTGNTGTFVPLPPSLGERLRDGASPLAAGSPRPVSPNGIAPASITGAQLAPGAIGAPQIAPGAVGVGQIDPLQVQARISEACPPGQYLRSINADGTVVCEAQSTLPRAAHTSSEYLTLTDVDTLVLSVTLNVPNAGTVLVNASGNFELLAAGSTGQIVVGALCSISLGTSVDAVHNANAVQTVVSPPATVQVVPFSSARGFDVGPGTFKANLVCRHVLQGGAGVDNPHLTALFVPAQ